MAQLPPKTPTMAQKWPSFTYHPIDDFVGFSSAKRNSHRRSTSNPIAFVEIPLMPSSDDNGFERLDDEQLSSMFSDDFATNVPLSSTSSDQNSDSDEHKTTSQQEQQPVQMKIETEEGGTIVDPKRVKRILANRQSAQRSRVRKLHYISELERSVTNLEMEVSTLSPRVAFFDHQRLILNVDNSSLKQRIAALAQDKIFKDAHQEQLKKEIERLRRVYQEQNMNKTDTAIGSPPPVASPPSGGSSIR